MKFGAGSESTSHTIEIDSRTGAECPLVRWKYDSGLSLAAIATALEATASTGIRLRPVSALAAMLSGLASSDRPAEREKRARSVRKPYTPASLSARRVRLWPTTMLGRNTR